MSKTEWHYLLVGTIGAAIKGAFPFVFALLIGEMLGVGILTQKLKKPQKTTTPYNIGLCHVRPRTLNVFKRADTTVHITILSITCKTVSRGAKKSNMSR